MRGIVARRSRHNWTDGVTTPNLQLPTPKKLVVATLGSLEVGNWKLGVGGWESGS